MAETEVKAPALVKGLGLLDATTLVMGSMIGSGVFIVAADISRQVQSPGLMMLTWVITAVLTIIAALSYGELSAAMPQAGGQYIYLREAFGPLYGFLYGWTFFTVIETGTIAAVAVAFAKFTGVLVPAVSTSNWLFKIGPVGLNTQMIVAISVIVLLTWVNTKGLRAGAILQNVFTIAKVGALLGFIALGVMAGRRPDAIGANFTDFWRTSGSPWDIVRVLGVAMVGALFSSDSWHLVTLAAGEIRNPKRDLPLSLALGVGVVSILYMGCNLVYLMALPLNAIMNAPEDRVATAVISQIMGPVATQVMAVAVMISTFGCINGQVLCGARVYYAMAGDGLFFKAVKRVDPVHHTPYVSLWVQCLWACMLTLTGRYNDLLDYVIFAVLLFYVLTIVGLFVLRRTRPTMERPYRAIGYPLLPALYIVAGSVIEGLLLIYKPNYTWPGLILVLLGIPVYFLWKRQSVEG
ncbi:amino acid permease [uncultured Paludibaculum sp.]|uniref:APC family permease n=1 Tax=uncultured Paludibaculum sp. TaxID=1765020 RepID=UPI002AAB1AB3|nr:amino acid permease [uncultured Paludibaculum sp.]